MSKHFTWVLTILAALAAIPPLISLIQHVLEVGLAVPLAEFIEFYRTLLSYVFFPLTYVIDAVLGIFGYQLSLPRFWLDLWILSLIGSTMFVRSIEDDFFHNHAKAKLKNELLARMVLVATSVTMIALFSILFIGVFLLGLMAFFAAAHSHQIFADEQGLGRREKVKLRAMRIFWATAAGVVFFYFTNYWIKMIEASQ